MGAYPIVAAVARQTSKIVPEKVDVHVVGDELERQHANAPVPSTWAFLPSQQFPTEHVGDAVFGERAV